VLVASSPGKERAGRDLGFRPVSVIPSILIAAAVSPPGPRPPIGLARTIHEPAACKRDLPVSHGAPARRSRVPVPPALIIALLLSGLSGPARGAPPDPSAPPARLAAAGSTADSARVQGGRTTRDTSVTIVFLVRHAEKNLHFLGSDPPLTEAGLRRADALSHALGDAGITAIYSTHFRRNRDTAAPLAARLGDSLRIVDQGDFAGFARRVREENPGGRVLIVGHSDTVPQIVQALAGVRAPPFAPGEHDVLYVVTLAQSQPSRTLRLRYGEPSAQSP